MKRGFVSDNCAPVHPRVMEALGACNALGHVPSYGADDDCARAREAFAEVFERRMPVEFVFNGTGANVLSLACCLRPYESIVCADCAHINADETGAPERVLGSKLQALPSEDGKLTPDQIVPLLLAHGNQHHSQPRVVSITNVTEWGAVYTPAEVRRMADFAHANDLLLHMDGARIANAVVAAECTMAEMTWQAGVDVLSFGGCKNGLMFGEAVLFFNKSLANAAPYLRKNITQLHSKMRYIGAQYAALLEGGLWRRNAEDANAMAARLQEELRIIPEVEIIHPAEANMLFVRMPQRMANAVCAAGFGSDMGDVVRMVTAWDTEDEEIEGLIQLLQSMSSAS
ncbi:threonine aldolase [Eubacteriales bacterium OttesenSCG-928-A19]|nr:threonine aldolase [Eubacteriales bacterium OttesenSCG-928-A19]